MQRFLILGAVGLSIAGMGVPRFFELRTKLETLDELERTVPRERREMRTELERVQGELVGLSSSLQDLARSEDAEVQRLRAQVAALEASLGETAEVLERQADDLAALEEVEAAVPRMIEDRLAEVEASVGERWSGLTDAVDATAHLARRASEEVDRLGAERARGMDRQERWRAIVGPTVQLAGTTTVGSGVLLASRPAPAGEGHETLLLTAWHVVRDIRADASEQDPPIPVSIYSPSGAVRGESAELLHFDPTLDVALLRLNTTEAVEHGARVPDREHVAEVQIFHPIYAVGCPLGNDPIPTQGEVADLTHHVDGSDYWMISAPTYIGNSGGGIYDAETHELLGVFSKIYTHGNMRPTVVPHMGLVVSMDRIYDWLEDEGYAHIAPAADGGVELVLGTE